MRLPGRTLGTCSSCDEELVRGAAWCGACGERVVPVPADAAEDDQVLEAESSSVPSTAGRASRWSAAAAVVALLATALVINAGRTPPPEAVLGRAGDGTNVTSTGLPPDELRLAWSRTLEVGPPWSEPGSFVADGDLARIGERVVDLTTGEVVRTADSRHDSSRYVTRLSHGDVVVVDQLTGRLVERFELPASVATMPAIWPAARLGDVTFLTSDEGGVVLRDDGTVLAELPGMYLDWQGTTMDEPAVVHVRDDLDGMHGEPTGDLHLVSMVDGGVVHTAPVADDAWSMVATMGDRTLIVQQVEGPVDVEFEPTPWRVELVDGLDGTLLGTWELGTGPPPRLLGRTDEGGTLLAAEHEDGVTVYEATVSGDLVPRTGVRRRGWDAYDSSGGITDMATLTEEGHVVELVSADAVVARTLDGTVLWQSEVTDGAAVREDGGVVAVLPVPPPVPDEAAAGVVQLLDASDGSLLAKVELTPPLDSLRWSPQPSAVVGDVVAVGRRLGGPSLGALDLEGTRWFELTTGREVTTQRLLADRMPDGTDPVGAQWLFSLDPPAAGGSPDVVVGKQVEQPGDGPLLRVLEADGFVDHGLDLGPAHARNSWLQPVGATGERLAVWAEAWTDDRQADAGTHVIDRSTGTTVRVRDVEGVHLADDLLVGFERDPEDWMRDVVVVGHDPVTGARRWTGPALPRHTHELLHDDDLLVAGDVFERRAVLLDDGSSPWTHRSEVELLSGGVLGRDHVLLATRGSEVVALDRASGVEVWRRDVGAPVLSLAGAGEGAVVTTLDRRVLVLDRDGQPQQVLDLGDVPFHAVALGDTLVVQYQDRLEGFRPDGTGFTAEDEVELP